MGLETPVYLLGASGNALDAIDILADIGAPYRVAGVFDDAPPGPTFGVDNIPILGPIDQAGSRLECDDACFLLTVGSARSYRVRAEIIARAQVPGSRYARIVSPDASVYRSAEIGHGCLVPTGSVLCAGSRLGEHVLLLPRVVLGHGSTIGDFSVVAAGAVLSGNVVVEPGCYVGAGAVVREAVRIGHGALVGMGAVVLHDIEADTVVVGNPARFLRDVETEKLGGA